MNRLVLSLRSYSSPLQGTGSDTLPVSELTFTQNRFLGDIGSPLCLGEDVDSLIEEEVVADTTEHLREAVISTVGLYDVDLCAIC